jgi:hypothetical protein
MNRATPQIRDFAERLVAFETRGKKSLDPKSPAAFHVCEKLRPHLTTLMGTGGFRVLLSRALTLASEEVPWLRAVQAGPDGTLAGLEELRAQLAPEELTGGQVALLSQLLGLLIAFIGENLTMQIVREVWPQLPFHVSGPDQGENK